MISDRIDRIDVEDLIKDFRVVDIEAFSSYLKEIWRVKNFITIGFSSKKR
jgi:hypothetical protein